MRRRLIVNADDLGLCPSVNTAIFDVFKTGNLSSATLMVAMPGTSDAVARLKRHPGLSVGLHFCITEGVSLIGRSTLTDADGVFTDRATLAKGSYSGKIDPDDISKELHAQLARMADLGVKPTHIDSHQHVHMLPRVLDAMVPVIHDLGLPLRVVDPPSASIFSNLGRPRKALKQWLNKRFAGHLRSRFEGRTNDLLVSIHDLENAGPYTGDTYDALLDRTPKDAVVELMVHPYILGHDVEEMYADVMPLKRPFIDRCVAEYDALSKGPVFRNAELIDFSQI